MIDTDQQRLYLNTTTIRWILGTSNTIPRAVAIQHISVILVRLFHFSRIVLPLTKDQSQSIQIVKQAHMNGRRLHIPRILLSTSIKFQVAYSQDPAGEPALSQISVDDVRIKQSPWYREDVKTPPPVVENGNSTTNFTWITELYQTRGCRFNRTIDIETTSSPSRTSGWIDQDAGPLRRTGTTNPKERQM